MGLIYIREKDLSKERDRMKCKDYQCRKGEIDIKSGFPIRTGCSGSSMAYPCSVCGRLHWHDGSPVRNRGGNRAFLKDGHLVNINRKGKEQIIW